MKKKITIEISARELETFENFLITYNSSTDDQEIKMMEMLLLYKKLLQTFNEL